MVKKDERLFGKLLSQMIKKAGMTHQKFYTELGIKKPYFYDIIGSRANPPPPEVQFRIIDILNPDNSTRNLFFELAGKERNEVPADIAWYLENNESQKVIIREEINYLEMINTRRIQ